MEQLSLKVGEKTIIQKNWLLNLMLVIFQCQDGV